MWKPLIVDTDLFQSVSDSFVAANSTREDQSLALTRPEVVEVAEDEPALQPLAEMPGHVKFNTGNEAAMQWMRNNHKTHHNPLRKEMGLVRIFFVLFASRQH